MASLLEYWRSLCDNIKHHRDIWREALKLDKARQKKPDSTRHAELSFLPAALEVAETPASPAARMLVLFIAVFFALTIAWASFGQLDIVATASGKIVPSGRIKQIQPLETSIVRAVNVSEGQQVKAGDILVELEITGGAADVRRLQAELDDALAESARLEALLSSDPIEDFSPPPDLPEQLVKGQRDLLQSQILEHRAKIMTLESEHVKKDAELITIEADLTRLQNVAVKIRDETERRQELARNGHGSQIDRLRSEKELADNLGQQQVLMAKHIETEAGRDSLKNQLNQVKEEFRRDAAEQLVDARSKAATSRQDLEKAAYRQHVQSLRAPVDGVVQQIDIHTVGGVVTPAQKLMVVIPNDSVLEVEAKLPNKDIGFVEAGQSAEVKVDAFPFTRYGLVPAKVEHVSLDAVKNEESPNKEFVFPIRLSLGSASITVENGKKVPLSPGMTVSVEVKTGSRRPIDYILSPLRKYGSESGRER